MFFRAFFALPPLRTSKGLPTNALYGFLSMSIKLLRENRPEYMAYCFDRKEPSFRSEIYPEYKAHREEMPDDLVPQLPYVRRLTELLGIPALDEKGYEADDVIGSLALFGAKHNCDVSIVSGDKDFAQLVNHHISLYDTMKEIRYDRQGVIEKWGVEPEQIIDYLAIVGDASDNIPGVRGVGPKGAQKLLAEFKTLKNIYENLDHIKSESLRNKLLDSREQAFLAQKLVTIKTDLGICNDLENLRMKSIDREKILALFTELEFEGFGRKLFGEQSPSASAAADAGEAKATRRSKSEVKPASSGAKKRGSVRVTGLTPWTREQWSVEQLKKRVQPYSEIWAVKNERGLCLGYDGKAIQVDATLREIGEVLSSKLLRWKGFDIKNLWKQIEMSEPLTPVWDTMLAAYVEHAGEIGGLPETYEKYCSKKVPDLATAEDLLFCELELEAEILRRLEGTRSLEVLNEIELPLVPVLYEMERRGVCVDRRTLEEQRIGLARDIESLEKEIFRQAGESFNISSPKQLGAILFEKLKIPVVRKTKTGYSTDSDVLTKLSHAYPICQEILAFRELAKLKSGYVDALPELIDSRDGRIHTSYEQAVTMTGRLSSINPNLQNIPIRTKRGRAIRKAFIAPAESVLLSLDYSQVELRILAEITDDSGLKAAFKKNMDIHAATASEIFNVSLHDVTPEQRRMAKAVNFGIAYGQGVYGLAETLEIERDEAKEIIENYFRKFRGVKEYMLNIVATAKERGYVETLFGRRRYIDEFRSHDANVRKFGERAAINAPMQGTASDIIKKAMIEIYRSSEAPMILQVHDELVLECSAKKVEAHAALARKIMESVVNWSVPLQVNAAWGENWEDAHA